MQPGVLNFQANFRVGLFLDMQKCFSSFLFNRLSTKDKKLYERGGDWAKNAIY